MPEIVFLQHKDDLRPDQSADPEADRLQQGFRKAADKKLNKTTKMHQNEIGEKITRHRPQKGPSFEWRPSRWRQPTLRHPTRRQGFWETFPFGLGKTHGTGVGWRVGLG